MDLTELREAFAAGQLVVFAGAALSIAPPACAPLFRPLRSLLYSELSDALSDEIPSSLRLPPERLFDEAGRLRDGVEPPPEILFEALGVQGFPIHLLLEDAVGVSDPNHAHRSLAAWLGRACPLVITTNFDRGIEDAAHALGKQPVVAATGAAMNESLPVLGSAGDGVIWKPHGSLSDPASIRVTLQEVAAERLDSAKLESLATVLRRFPVLVIGYSGYDYDLSSVFRACGDDGRRLWWLCLSEPQPTEPAHFIVRTWQDRGTVLVGDLEELLAALALDAPDAPPAAPMRVAGSCADSHVRRREAVRRRFRENPAFFNMITLALIYKSLGEQSAAAELFRRADDLAQRDNSIVTSHEVRTMVLQLRAETLFLSGRSREALDVLTSEEFLAGLEQATMREEFCNAFMLRGQILTDLGMKAEGAADLRKAIELGTGSQFGMRAQALLSMAARGGDSSQARSRLLEAREYFEAAADRRGLMRVDHELAILATDRGDISEARDILAKVAAEARELGDGQAEQFAVHELAIAAGHDKEWAEAFKWLDRYDAITAYRGDVTGSQLSRALRADITVDQSIAARDGAGLSETAAHLMDLLQDDLAPRPRALALRALVWAAVGTSNGPLAEQAHSRLAELAEENGHPDIIALASGAGQLFERARPHLGLDS